MNPEWIGFSIALCILPLIIGGGLLFSKMRDDQRLATRFSALHRPKQAMVVTDGAAVESIRSVVFRVVSSLGAWVLRLGLLSGRTRGDVEASLSGAGHSGTAALQLFIGAKILLFLALPGGMWLAMAELDTAFMIQLIASAAAAMAGLLAPDMAIRKLKDRHMRRIENELPDALDLMVICAQAGLGLGVTIVRVAHELRHSHRAVALELARTANELQMMTDTKIPLVHFGNRCGVESARRLATTLLQSAQYGTPLTEALRGLAGELREELITRFEARAARMSVLLTMPMIVFILPCVFLIVGGPAAIQVAHALK